MRQHLGRKQKCRGTSKIKGFIMTNSTNTTIDIITDSKKESTSTIPLFFVGAPKTDQYLFDRSALVASDEAIQVKKNKKSGKELIQPVTYCETTDTEFYTKLNILSQQTRTGLSTQCKGISSKAPKWIAFHPEHAQELNEARVKQGLKALSVVKSEAHFVDYLQSCGVDIKIVSSNPSEIKELPNFYYQRYAHFDTAEMLMIFSGSMKTEVKKAVDDKIIQSRRRTIIVNPTSKGFSKQKSITLKTYDWFEFQHHAIELNGVRFALRMKIIDTCAIHGVSGYGDVAKTVGWMLQHKDKFTKAEKAKMLEMALTRPQDFEDYALGDLDVYDILNAYNEQWKEVYNKLGLREGVRNYYQQPKPTIGGTVKDLFLAALAKKLNVGTYDEEKDKFEWKYTFEKKVIKKYLTFNPGEMRQYFKSTKCLLSKVEGGRCRNNRPTDIFVRRKIKGKYDVSLVCDIDISGCYGEGQRNQPFFIGVPVTFGLEYSKYNEYPTLRKVLTQLGVKIDVLVKKNRQDWIKPENWGELITGGWYFRISTKERLKYPQDLIASWFTVSGYGVDIMAKFIKENETSDTELTDKLETVDFDEEYGITKIFEHEIHNGVLTHDILQWILGVASKYQRNELLDKIVVLSGAFYPRSQEIKPTSWETALDELDKVYDNWQGKNTYDLLNGKYGNVVQTKDESCHAWFSLNLGELIVNDLLIERKKAQITHGKKSPLDLLFKLCVNTLYGDMVSKFFATSNPIVGNNITARARCLAWYMEKGFNGWQSITDGCGFLLNSVLKSHKNLINGELTIGTRQRLLKNRDIQEIPLGGEEIKGQWIENPEWNEDSDKPKYLLKLFSGENEITTEWIDNKAMEHLTNTFDCVDILHSETTAIKVDKNDCSVSFVPRVGQFSFETKDVYHSAAFHGSANYIFENPNYTFENPNGRTIKMRGYELKRTHEGWMINSDDVDDETFTKSERYDDKNNPGKDFMNQLLDNPHTIKRQETGIKEGILKISQYQDCIEKFNKLGIEPGDTIKKAMLMQEFSMTQFTFKTYEQYISWKKIIHRDKDSERQSLEGFFLNSDGTLDFVKMTEWVYDAIQRGIMNPYEELDPHRNKERSQKRSKNDKGNQGRFRNDVTTKHPYQVDYERVKKKLNGELV